MIGLSYFLKENVKIVKRRKKTRKAIMVAVGVVVLLIASNDFIFAHSGFWYEYQPSEATYGLWHFNGTENEAIKDSSSFHHPARLTGKVSISTKGRFAEALEIKEGGLEVSLQECGVKNMAIEAWVKLSSYPQKESFVLDKPFKRGKYDGFSLTINPGGGFKLRLINSVGYPIEYSSSREIPLGQWTHIACVIADRVLLYLNGREVLYEKRGPKGEEDIIAGALYIGSSHELDTPFPGLIDEVRISTNSTKRKRDGFPWRFFEKPDNSWTDPDKVKTIRKIAEEDILFYASFDGTAVPEIYKTEKVLVKENVKYDNGVWGKGMIGDAVYSVEGNLDFEIGSLEMWIKPINWDNISSRGLRFFRGGGKLYIFNSGTAVVDGNPITFYVKKEKGKSPYQYHNAPGFFYPDCWHHIVVTWSGKLISIYMDGELKFSSQTSLGLSYPDNVFNIGSGEKHQTVIDEVYIYKKALSEKEVEEAYLRYKQ